MSNIYLFWDKLNDELEIVGDDGEIYFYSEDKVEISQTNGTSGRFWTKLNKYCDVTPLNDHSRFDVFDPELNDWIEFGECRNEFVKEIHEACGDFEEIF